MPRVYRLAPQSRQKPSTVFSGIVRTSSSAAVRFSSLRNIHASCNCDGSNDRQRRVRRRSTTKNSFVVCSSFVLIVADRMYSAVGNHSHNTLDHELMFFYQETWTVGVLLMSFPRHTIFIARQHTAADARYWYSNSVRLSVRPSVRDTLVFYENGLTYRHSFSTIR